MSQWRRWKGLHLSCVAGTVVRWQRGQESRKQVEQVFSASGAKDTQEEACCCPPRSQARSTPASLPPCRPGRTRGGAWHSVEEHRWGSNLNGRGFRTSRLSLCVCEAKSTRSTPSRKRPLRAPESLGGSSEEEGREGRVSRVPCFRERWPGHPCRGRRLSDVHTRAVRRRSDVGSRGWRCTGRPRN